jgi:hypothetical protein
MTAPLPPLPSETTVLPFIRQVRREISPAERQHLRDLRLLPRSTRERMRALVRAAADAAVRANEVSGNHGPALPFKRRARS